MASTLKKKTSEPETAPVLPVIPDFDETTMLGIRAWVEDKTVRAVRAFGYCREAEGVMKSVLGDPLDGQSFRDSEGVDCWGNTWRDANGYDRNGFDRHGRDAEGFTRDGWDRRGFNRDGFDKDGTHKDDPARYRFNYRGFSMGSWNVLHMDRDGRFDPHTPDLSEEELGLTLLAYSYDATGRDRDGYNASGYTTDGQYDEGHDVRYMSDRVRYGLIRKWGLVEAWKAAHATEATPTS